MAVNRDAVPLAGLNQLEIVTREQGTTMTIELAQRSAAEHIRLVIIPGSQSVQRVLRSQELLELLPFIDNQPVGSRAARSRTAQDGAAGSGGAPLPAARRRPPPNAAGADPSLVRPGRIVA